MIVGLLSDIATQQHVLPEAIVRGVQALEKLDLMAMSPGRYELEGDKLFCLIQDAVPRTMVEGKPEAHFVYADVQMPLTAIERYGFSMPQSDLIAVDDRLESSDVAFYPTPRNENFIDIAPGEFVVFMPKELHRPCIVIEDQKKFRKAVLKIHSSLLGF